MSSYVYLICIFLGHITTQFEQNINKLKRYIEGGGHKRKLTKSL